MTEKHLKNLHERETTHDASPIFPISEVAHDSSAFEMPEEPERDAHILKLTQELKSTAYSGPEDYDVNDIYEINGVLVDTNELSLLVDELSPEDYRVTEEMTQDVLALSDTAHNEKVSFEARHQAKVATVANALFGSVDGGEATPAEVEQMAEAKQIVEREKGEGGFTHWVGTKGKKVVGALLATMGMGVAAPAMAGGGNPYEAQAATAGVRVIGSVLGTMAERPFVMEQKLGTIEDKARFADQEADLRMEERMRDLSVREQAKLDQVKERVKIAQSNYTVGFKMYKLSNPSATEEDFVSSKEGKPLYKQLLIAEERAKIDSERILSGTNIENKRIAAQHDREERKIQLNAERQAQKAERDQTNRELNAMRSGARQIVTPITRAIFRR